MVKLIKSDVKHVAELADFRLSEKEVLKFQEELSETLEFVNILGEISTKGVKPTSHVTGLQDVTKGDVSRPSLSQEQTLRNAPSIYNNFFKVKSIF